MFLNIKRAELFSKISQEEIMSRYFGEFKIGKKYRNPFRATLGLKADNTPGCSFNYSNTTGMLLFYDKATEKVFYDCVAIAELATGIMKPEIYTHLWNTMGASTKNTLENLTLRTGNNKKSDIRVELEEFKSKDLDYFIKGNITLEILKYFDIRRVKRAWINGFLWGVSTPGNPIYRYRQKDSIKLYAPFAKKSDKFRNNYNKGFLDGWLQLPATGKKIYLVKAYKDVLTLFSLGITSVGVLSESTLVSTNALQILQSRFTEVIPYLDNDETGLKMIEKYKKETGLIGISNPIGKPKDPFDWACKDIEDFKTFIKECNLC